MFDTLSPWIAWIGTVSLVLFLTALILLPLILRKMPENIFIRNHEKKKRHPFIHFLLLILRNLAGALLFIMGVIMLFIPGQGILTIFSGFVLMTFPGKKRLVSYLISLPFFQNSLNRFRIKLGKPPFMFPQNF